jgi:predicted deacetylase
MPPPERLVAIELHDVAPATWPACERILRVLDDAGARNLTLLVVPRFHRGVAVRDDAAFVRAMHARLAHGDELALHGYYHLDLAPAPRNPAAYVARRILTRAEGEFAAISERDAAARLQRGVALFGEMGWPLHGFVPPAWLLGAAARRAIGRCTHAFAYVAVRNGVHRLPTWDYTPCANAYYSPDRRWRRLLSRLLIRRALERAQRLPLLRLAIHPQDARVPEVLAHWRTLVEEALAVRAPVTKHAFAVRAPVSTHGFATMA